MPRTKEDTSTWTTEHVESKLGKRTVSRTFIRAFFDFSDAEEDEATEAAQRACEAQRLSAKRMPGIDNEGFKKRILAETDMVNKKPHLFSQDHFNDPTLRPRWFIPEFIQSRYSRHKPRRLSAPQAFMMLAMEARARDIKRADERDEDETRSAHVSEHELENGGASPRRRGTLSRQSSTESMREIAARAKRHKQTHSADTRSGDEAMLDAPSPVKPAFMQMPLFLGVMDLKDLVLDEPDIEFDIQLVDLGGLGMSDVTDKLDWQSLVQDSGINTNSQAFFCFRKGEVWEINREASLRGVLREQYNQMDFLNPGYSIWIAKRAGGKDELSLVPPRYRNLAAIKEQRVRIYLGAEW